jgi:hypothetical protein
VRKPPHDLTGRLHRLVVRRKDVVVANYHVLNNLLWLN